MLFYFLIIVAIDFFHHSPHQMTPTDNKKKRPTTPDIPRGILNHPPNSPQLSAATSNCPPQNLNAAMSNVGWTDKFTDNIRKT